LNNLTVNVVNIVGLLTLTIGSKVQFFDGDQTKSHYVFNYSEWGFWVLLL